MKTLIITGLCPLMMAAGCSSPEKKKVGYSKTFYGRTISDDIEPEAKEDLHKLETLISRSHQVDPPIPDELIVPLYRNADQDRDHYITSEEAKAFYHEFVINFENSLGTMQYRR